MKSGDGSIGGRLRIRSKLLRTMVSCREHAEHVARCCSIARISANESTSSTKAT
jgi:Trp operon repressor